MRYDVVIAGAGPVGLLLACELCQAGSAVLVLEQAASPDSPLKRLPFGLRGLNAPTLEALDRRGVLDAVAAGQVLKPEKGPPPPSPAPAPRFLPDTVHRPAAVPPGQPRQ